MKIFLALTLILLAFAVPAANVAAAPWDVDPDEEAAEAALAFRYRPVLYVQKISDDCVDGRLDFGPLPVDAVLGSSSARLRGPEATVYNPQPPDVFLKGPAYFLDLPGDPTNPGCRYARDFAALQGSHPPVVYARVAGEPERNGIVLQYWFFYYFNDWNNKHEGDWEMIQLFFKANSARGALREEPDLLSYTQHNGGETARWDSGKLEREGTRPVVYVARGSHGNYFRPHSYLGVGEKGTGLGCDVASGKRERIDPRIILLPKEPLPPESAFGWTVYFGKWGQVEDPAAGVLSGLLEGVPVLGPWLERQGSEFDGPPGPNATIRWPQPITWQEKLRPSSVIVPGAGLLGQDALRSFCSGVTFLGNALSSYERWPDFALVALAGSLGVLAGAAFFTLRRAPKAGLAGLGRNGAAQRRRNLPQVLLAAAIFYAHRWRTFLAIGAISIPFGLVGSLVTDFLLSKPPLGSLAGLYGNNLAIQALIALQYGLLQLRLLYPLILVTVAISVRETEAGREISPARAFQLALGQLPDVLLARLRTLAYMVPLSLSVVGIPLALYLSVRWNFVEQTVIFDRERPASALGRSASLVGGSSWRVAILSLLIALMLAVSVPLLAAFFLYASSLSPAAINAVTGIFFVALIPYVALCVTFLYFDLVERQGPATA